MMMVVVTIYDRDSDQVLDAVHRISLSTSRRCLRTWDQSSVILGVPKIATEPDRDTGKARRQEGTTGSLNHEW